MDKQDAIKCLKSMQQWIPDWDDREDRLSYWDAIDMAIAALSPPNEPLACEGCYWKTHGSFGQCFDCVREKQDNYRRPPEGEEDT